MAGEGLRPSSKYPTSDRRQATGWMKGLSLVLVDDGEHAKSNPDFICYSGSEIIYDKLSDAEIRAKAHTAMQEMIEQFPRDFPDLADKFKKYRPGAMGVHVRDVSGNPDYSEVSYHSTLRRKEHQDGPAGLEEARITAWLQAKLYDEGGDLPRHGKGFKCTEPGFLSNLDEAYFETGPSSRVYVTGKNGTFLPACGGDKKYGCRDIIKALGAAEVGDGPSETRHEVTKYGRAISWTNDDGGESMVSVPHESVSFSKEQWLRIIERENKRRGPPKIVLDEACKGEFPDYTGTAGKKV